MRLFSRALPACGWDYCFWAGVSPVALYLWFCTYLEGQQVPGFIPAYLYSNTTHAQRYSSPHPGTFWLLTQGDFVEFTLRMMFPAD